MEKYIRSIKVNLDKTTLSSYEIRIGDNILDRILLLIAKNHKAGRHIVITDNNVGRLHGQKLVAGLKDVGLNAALIEFPAGEASKNINTVIEVAGKLLELGADRNSLLIGFIASVFMRSIAYIQIPTTLLAQVDSSIGGKTAIDLPYGKNLLGTFYQPKAVFTDLNYLTTLPEKEFKNGLAEIIKYGIIDDEKMFCLLEDSMEQVKRKDSTLLLKLVGGSCLIKKAIVEIDEKEQGLRRILNYGHTLGHALEAQSNFTISHGEGVALGIIAAARISENAGYLDAASRQRIENVIHKSGLPYRIPKDLSTKGIISRLRMDKKKEGDIIHFVLIKKIGMPFVNGGIDNKIITCVIEGMK